MQEIILGRRKGDSSRIELQNEHVKIIQIRLCNFLGKYFTDDRKCSPIWEIVFPKSREFHNKKMKRLLKCYVLSILLHESEFGIVSSQMEKRLRKTDLWFYRKSHNRISWKKHLSNEEVLMKIWRKRQLCLESETERVQNL